MSFDLDSYLQDLRRHLSEALESSLPAPGASDPLSLRTAMLAAVLQGGKRLRPCLTIAACQAVGGTTAQALRPACAVEMIHCYSLVHDDLPAMDDDDMRRGHPTCHKRYGEATAILAGDGLLTRAFELLAKEGLREQERSSPLLKATLELASAAGVSGMVGGQAVDMMIKGEPPSFEALERCHADKTAALFSASTTIGALVGGGNETQVGALRGYGQDLGLAFQHADDLRDADFPHFRQRSLERSEQLSSRAAETAGSFGSAGAPLVAMAELVQQRAREAIHDQASTQD